MRILELKDIVGYLPYKLNVKEKKEGYIQTIIGLKVDGSVEYNNWNAPDNHKLNDIIPILKPMSDLNKSIKVDGYNNNKEFNPILEIAKLCIPSKTWYIDEKSKKIQYKNTPYYCHSSKTDRIYFKFYKAAFIRYDDKGILDEVASPFEVINLLYQWNFDTHNLIDKGLALDINTLNKK